MTKQDFGKYLEKKCSSYLIENFSFEYSVNPCFIIKLFSYVLLNQTKFSGGIRRHKNSVTASTVPANVSRACI